MGRKARTYERKRKKDERRILKGERRCRFGIYADRCSTVNRPIREGFRVGLAGQSRPLFFRRTSLDRRLVFRILYYTVLPGPRSSPRASSPASRALWARLYELTELGKREKTRSARIRKKRTG